MQTSRQLIEVLLMCASQLLNAELVISFEAVKLSRICLLSTCVTSIVKASTAAFELNPYNIDFPVIEALQQLKFSTFQGVEKGLIVDTGFSWHLENKVSLRIKTGSTSKNGKMYTHT